MAGLTLENGKSEENSGVHIPPRQQVFSFEKAIQLFEIRAGDQTRLMHTLL